MHSVAIAPQFAGAPLIEMYFATARARDGSALFR